MFAARKQKKLEDERQEVLDNIRYELWDFELMAQRAHAAGETPNPDILSAATARFAEFKQQAANARKIDEFDDLIEKAEMQGTLRAYICPTKEIVNEGNLAIDLLAEWGVPKITVDELRNTLGQQLAAPDTARGALRTIFAENNSWNEYTDDYEKEMKKYTLSLVAVTAVLLLLAGVGFYFRLKIFPLIFLLVLLFAGAAGSCVSVIRKMPLLDVSLSSELDAYGRRILSRVVTGTVASLVGSALLAWGVLPIAIQGQTFADVMSACTAHDTSLCTITKALILLAVPVLFGFSERTLTSFEQKVLGGAAEKP
jgi:hypothetical protein